MAIYHFCAKVISRSSGRSATGAAAYRSAEKIKDERTGEVHDYSRKGRVDHKEIVAPDNSPHWVNDRSQLWNAVEAIEKRKDAQLCREIEVSLPVELKFDDMKTLVKDFVTKEFVEKGMIADIAIHHAKHAKSENPHAHMLLTMRELSKDGFGNKNRDWNKTEQLEKWRENWATAVNKALELSGHDVRIDHRSLEGQGIDRAPQIHLGPKVIEMEQRGIKTERGAQALLIDRTNESIEVIKTQKELVSRERNYEVKTGTERRGNGERDRALSSELSGSGRPDRANARSDSEIQPRPGPGMEQAAAAGSASAESSRSADRERSASLSGSDRRGKTSLVESDLDSSNLDAPGVSLGGGSYERVLALAATSDKSDNVGRGGGSQASSTSSSPTKAQTLDRTYLAVRRQLAAMGCDSYDVGIRDRQGRMLTRTWSVDQVLKATDFLKRENAKGADIYIRPAGENQGLILVDDLKQGDLAKMKAAGLAPALVVETSPYNHQAWVRVSAAPMPRPVATAVAKQLAADFGGDANSADWRHFGRLSGFTNRKPEHITESGRNPWVLCHESSGNMAVNGPELAQRAQEHVSSLTAQAERKMRLDAARNASERVYGRDPVAEYQRQLRRLETRYGVSMDISKADFMIAKDMAKQGYGFDELETALQQASPELSTRKAGHEADYAERTVRAAFADPEVQLHQDPEVQLHQLQQTRGMSR